MLEKCGFHVEHSRVHSKHSFFIAIHLLLYIYFSNTYSSKQQQQQQQKCQKSVDFMLSILECTHNTHWAARASIAKHIASHNTNSTEGPLHGLSAYMHPFHIFVYNVSLHTLSTKIYRHVQGLENPRCKHSHKVVQFSQNIATPT